MITKEHLLNELATRIKGIKPGVETTTDNIIAEMKSILVLVDALPNYEKKYNEDIERASHINSREGWAARDKNGHLNFFLGEPYRIKNTRGEEYWVGHGRMKQPDEFLSELSWDDEPIKVELTINPKPTDL